MNSRPLLISRRVGTLVSLYFVSLSKLESLRGYVKISRYVKINKDSYLYPLYISLYVLKYTYMKTTIKFRFEVGREVPTSRQYIYIYIYTSIGQFKRKLFVTGFQSNLKPKTCEQVSHQINFILCPDDWITWSVWFMHIKQTARIENRKME